MSWNEKFTSWILRLFWNSKNWMELPVASGVCSALFTSPSPPVCAVFSHCLVLAQEETSSSRMLQNKTDLTNLTERRRSEHQAAAALSFCIPLHCFPKELCWIQTQVYKVSPDLTTICIQMMYFNCCLKQHTTTKQQQNKKNHSIFY